MLKNASESRKIATTIAGEAVGTQIKQIADQIDLAANQGHRSLYIAKTLFEGTIKLLKDAGYVIKTYDGDFRGENSTTISW
jgi:hypothetical protein